MFTALQAHLFYQGQTEQNLTSRDVRGAIIKIIDTDYSGDFKKQAIELFSNHSMEQSRVLYSRPYKKGFVLTNNDITNKSEDIFVKVIEHLTDKRLSFFFGTNFRNVVFKTANLLPEFNGVDYFYETRTPIVLAQMNTHIPFAIRKKDMANYTYISNNTDFEAVNRLLELKFKRWFAFTAKRAGFDVKNAQKEFDDLQIEALSYKPLLIQTSDKETFKSPSIKAVFKSNHKLPSFVCEKSGLGFGELLNIDHNIVSQVIANIGENYRVAS